MMRTPKPKLQRDYHVFTKFTPELWAWAEANSLVQKRSKIKHAAWSMCVNLKQRFRVGEAKVTQPVITLQTCSFPNHDMIFIISHCAFFSNAPEHNTSNRKDARSVRQKQHSVSTQRNQRETGSMHEPRSLHHIQTRKTDSSETLCTRPGFENNRDVSQEVMSCSDNEGQSLNFASSPCQKKSQLHGIQSKTTTLLTKNKTRK